MARNLSDWLAGYIEYTANLEAPEKFHFWAGVATLAGALQGKCWINMGKWKWKPNFYIIFVAPPGIIGKSTTSGVGMGLLRDVEGIHFGPDSVTWQALLDSFIECSEDFPMPDGSFLASSSITLAISELGIFLDPQDRQQVDMLVHMWDGMEVPLKRRTKGEGEQIVKNPWLNLIACTTPSWIAEHIPEYAIGGGFTSRTVFVFGDHKRKLIPYPTRMIGSAYAEGFRPALLNDLKQISRMSGEFELSKDAFEWGETWYENHWMELPDHLRDERMAGYVARKQTHLHKLAMIVSASRRDTMQIYADDLKFANAIITSLEADAPKVFGKIFDSKEAKYAEIIFQLIRSRKKVSKQQLWRATFHAMSLQDFENSLAAVINTGYVKSFSNGSDVHLIFDQSAVDTFVQSLETPSQTSFDSASPSLESPPPSSVQQGSG